jgi:hypothetical protein
MREDCAACHESVAGRPEIRCTHPERVNCRQCHVPQVADFRAERLTNGSVRVELLSDLERLSPHPIRECALQVQNNADVDLAVTLDRGRVEFINRKKTGPATVRVSGSSYPSST